MAPRYGRTAMHVAAATGSVRSVRLLGEFRLSGEFQATDDQKLRNHYLGGGFKDFSFSSLFGEMIKFD